MKIVRKQKSISALAVAAIMLSTGAYYIADVSFNKSDTVLAYVSAINTQDPETAPDSYVVNIPDNNLRTALNIAIASATGTTRANDAQITAGDMRNLVGTPGSSLDFPGTPVNLNSRNISNLEGLQYATNLRNLTIERNNITNVAPIADLTKLEILRIERNRITDIAPLASTPKLEGLYAGYNNISNIAPIATSSSIRDLHINNMQIGSSKLNLSALASMPRLWRLNTNTNNLNQNDYEVLKTSNTLEVLMMAGNALTNIHTLLDDGFPVLKLNSTFSGMIHTINTDRDLIPNPIRNIDNTVIPVVETSKIKNADADGTLNPNGDHIKIVDTAVQGDDTVTWSKEFARAGWLQLRTFSGKLIINYNLDATAPTFDPAAPAKIVSRKGVAININDVSANDNPGGSGINPAGVTNDAAAIGLNPNSPASGNYTLTYLTSDNRNNTASVTREIEITDTDALQTKVSDTTDDTLIGYTAATVNEVKAKRQAAQDVINNATATQAEINSALVELNQAINNLEVSPEPIDVVMLGDYAATPAYVRNDSAVAAAYRQAEQAKQNPNRTFQDVQDAAQNLQQAINAAKQAELDRQAAAEAAIAAIEADIDAQSANTIGEARRLTGEVKDSNKNTEFENRIDAISSRLAANQQSLTDLIDRANDPSATNGRSPSSIANLRNVLREAEALDHNNNGDATIGQLADLITRLGNALNQLTVDKQPLVEAMQHYDRMPDYIKNNPRVKAAYDQAEATNNEADPSVDDVRNHARALQDTLNAILREEAEIENVAEEVLLNAANALNAPNLAPDFMPTINFANIEQLINRVWNAGYRADLMDLLSDLRAAYADRQAQVDAYIRNRNANGGAINQSQPGAQVEQQNANNAKAPNTGHQRKDTKAGLVVAAGAGAVALLGAVVAFVTRKKQ